VLRVAYRIKAVAGARLGKLSEAEDDWGRMMAAATHVDTSIIDQIAGPFYLPAWAGQTDKAIAVAGLMQHSTLTQTLHPELSFHFAEVLALAAGQEDTPQVAETHARNAVYWLERAEKEQFFEWNTKHKLHDHVFHTLRDRDDFKKLLERVMPSK
jgi:hypothetical protein